MKGLSLTIDRAELEAIKDRQAKLSARERAVLELMAVGFTRGEMLWGRRAIVTVRSKNEEGSMHAVYWSGAALFDPSTRTKYESWGEVEVKEALIFNEARPSQPAAAQAPAMSTPAGQTPEPAAAADPQREIREAVR